MATSNHSVWSGLTTSNGTIATGSNIASLDAVFTDTISNNGMTVRGDLTVGNGGTLLVQVDGESVNVSEKLSETEVLLGIMTTLLDTLIKDNPGITSAKSIEELIDQHKILIVKLYFFLMKEKIFIFLIALLVNEKNILKNQLTINN